MKVKIWGFIQSILLLFPLAALAADESPLSAAAGLTTDNFTLILKIGVPSGLISAVFTLIGVFLTNRAAQKNNREKIAAEAENISRQINQRQSEFETQTKLQLESLHSEEKKKACGDFLASVMPTLFRKNEFEIDKMYSCVPFLYLYCKPDYLLYFKNLMYFITKNRMPKFGKNYQFICDKIIEAENEYKIKNKKSFLSQIESEHDPNPLAQQIHEHVVQKNKMLSFLLNEYTPLYEQALTVAQKMIWNEPLEKAQLLPLEELPSEDDI